MLSQAVRTHRGRNKELTKLGRVVSLHTRENHGAVQETRMAQRLCSHLECHNFLTFGLGCRQFNQPWLPCTPGAGASPAASLLCWGWGWRWPQEGQFERAPGEGGALVCMALIELSQPTLFGHNSVFFYGRCLNWGLYYQEDLRDLPRHKTEADSSAVPGIPSFPPL